MICRLKVGGFGRSDSDDLSVVLQMTGLFEGVEEPPGVRAHVRRSPCGQRITRSNGMKLDNETQVGILCYQFYYAFR